MGTVTHVTGEPTDDWNLATFQITLPVNSFIIHLVVQLENSS